jgi:hypothetical protein
MLRAGEFAATAAPKVLARRLLYDAGLRVGTSLDVLRTADELARSPVPRFADFVTVDLADAVLHGEEPARTATDIRRAAVCGIRDDHPLCEPGRLFDCLPSTPQALGYGSGRSQLVSDLPTTMGWRVQDPERTKAIIDYGVHSPAASLERARAHPPTTSAVPRGGEGSEPSPEAVGRGPWAVGRGPWAVTTPVLRWLRRLS